jgi:hypothetical protein
VWSGRNLSIGGRVTLINSVLSSLPLYFFSFFKAPVCVLKEMVSIQRSFLWGGGVENKKMCWVSWDRICQPKKRGGLGIKNLAIFNSSLLCKWKWRGLSDRTAPWYDLLRFRYGSLVANFLYGEGRHGLKRASIWWRDVWSLGSDDEGGWFCNYISSILGDGSDVGFWKEKWVGTVPLRESFPDLFIKSAHQDCSISAMGEWVSHDWRWNFVWSSGLTDIEKASADELFLLLEQLRPRRDISDRRKWIPHVTGLFSVNSTYISLLNRLELEALHSNTTLALNKLWRTNVPSKVGVFGWRLMLDKLPTKDALFTKGIITSHFDRCCVFCSIDVEDTLHVFLNCHMISQVWDCIFKWMGVHVFSSPSVTEHFIAFGGLLSGKKAKKFRYIIWMATTWCIWRTRNNILFRGAPINILSLVNQIVYIAWLWFIGRLGSTVDFSFTDWCNNPLDCFSRL